MAYALETTLVSSRTDTAAVTRSNGTAITGMDLYRRGTFMLNVSAASGTWTLNVAIQAYIGARWSDIARFAEMSATGQRWIWDVGGSVNNAATVEEAEQYLAITVSTKRAGPWGTQLRATWTITGTGQSITWELLGTVSS